MDIVSRRKPVIGVFVSEPIIRKLDKQNRFFRGYARIFSLAWAAAATNVTLYFFSPGCVDIKNNSIYGTYYHKKRRRWRWRKFQLPDVLYDRLINGPGHTKAAHIVSVLRKRNVFRINSQSYFDTWNLYERLNQVPHLQKYVPTSVLYENASDLAKFFKSHDEVLLKGTVGWRGRWVLKARKLPEGNFEYRYFVGDDFVTACADNWNEFIRIVETFFEGRSFIIQDPLRLLEADKGPIDFRAELQRNGKGNLNIAGISARVGKSNSPVTIRSSSYPIDDFLLKYFSRSEEEIKPLVSKIRAFVVSIYKALEEEYGNFGELGIDFGLDREGRIWFTESSPISAKLSFMKAYGKRALRRSYIGLLDYAKKMHSQKNRTRNLTVADINNIKPVEKAEQRKTADMFVFKNMNEWICPCCHSVRRSNKNRQK